MIAKAGKFGDYVFSIVNDRKTGTTYLTITKKGMTVREARYTSFKTAENEVQTLIDRSGRYCS